MDAGELFDKWLKGTVSRGEQVVPGGVCVTVAQVLTTHAQGALDFGGGEFSPAALHALEPAEHSPGDKYAWWRLQAGAYVVTFNEELLEGAPAVLLTADQRLVECGCGLTAVIFTAGPLRSVLTVPGTGVKLKQNARIGLLRPVQ